MKNLLQLILVILFYTGTTNFLIAGTEIPGGDVSGTWTFDGSPYMVNGNITIPDGQTLIIEPGVEVIFTEHYKFIIQGQLLAIGTINSMITFSAQDIETGWHGLRFIDIPVANDSSRLVYCEIMDGRAEGPSLEETRGGGIYVESTDKLVVSFCKISMNRTQGDLSSGGGGIFIYDCSPIITQNLIDENEAEGGHGGGIGILGIANPAISNNIISHNIAFGGGGIAVAESQPIILQNTITQNNAHHGGGIDCLLEADPTFINTITYENNANTAGNEVHFADESMANFYYCNIEGGKDAFAHDHIQGFPGYDGYYENNIDADPLFVDINNDFHLMGTSPCISAAVQQIELNGIVYHAPTTDFYGQPRPLPQGSSPDIGAIESDIGTRIDLIANNKSSRFLEPYPNPIKSKVFIPFYLNHSERVTIEIYTMSGQRIITLTDSYQSHGNQFVIWNTNGIPDGVYICTMKTNNGTVDSKKLIVHM